MLRKVEIPRLRLLLIFMLIVCYSTQLTAEEHPEINRFCMWKASAAQTIAMNRDLGLEEVKVMAYYLNQQTTYGEQKIVLGLIEEIYGPYKFDNNDTVYSQIQKTCLHEFEISPAEEIAAAH